MKSKTGSKTMKRQKGNAALPDIVFQAIEVAAKAHSGQYRKGTMIPYIIHPLRVGVTLIEYGCRGELAAAGILHDVVEDTPLSVDDVQRAFGADTAFLVKAVSEPDKGDTWKRRKKHTLKQLESASLDVLLVSCADKLDNVLSLKKDIDQIGESVWSRFRKTRKHQSWYYTSLSQVFETRADQFVDSQSQDSSADRSRAFALLAERFEKAVYEVFHGSF